MWRQFEFLVAPRAQAWALPSCLSGPHIDYEPSATMKVKDLLSRLLTDDLSLMMLSGGLCCDRLEACRMANPCRCHNDKRTAPKGQYLAVHISWSHYCPMDNASLQVCCNLGATLLKLMRELCSAIPLCAK